MMLCSCGCGQPAPIGKMACSGHHMRLRTCKSDSYRKARRVGHPRANKANGCVLKHILIAERALGRYLPNGAQVHHVDGNRLNNANGNLVICQDGEFHSLLHVRTRVLMAGGNPNTQRVCYVCRQPRDFSEFHRRLRNKSGGVDGVCLVCKREQQVRQRERRNELQRDRRRLARELLEAR
jgi:hypothetical protein